MCFGGGGSVLCVFRFQRLASLTGQVLFVCRSYSGYGKVGFDRRFRVYEISDYGEKIRTWKRLDKGEAEPEGEVTHHIVLYPQPVR